MTKRSHNTEPKRKYILELDEDQVQALSNACEIASRLAMGQFTEITNDLWFHWKVDHDTRDVCENILTTSKSMLTGLDRNSYFSISSPDVAENFKIMYDLHQVVRYRLAWDRNPSDDWNVHKNEPLKVSQSPLAKISSK